MEVREIRPQSKQEQFLSSPADIAIFGGQAFGGKTYSLLMEPLRHIERKNFAAVIFRRTYPEITNEGGLWDSSFQLYPLVGAEPSEGKLEWKFPTGATVRFAHMQHEKDKLQWDGAQVPLIEFDQLESFSWGQFTYMFKASRTSIGIRPYIRASCNPDATSFLRTFLTWWINDETGLPIPERSGILRYFKLVNDEVEWSDEPSPEKQSVTFIPSSRYDNPIGMEANPDYEARLEGLALVDRLRMREGNWNAKPAAGNFFKRQWFEVVSTTPVNLVQVVRYWDRAATEPNPSNPDPDWTCGYKLGKDAAGFTYIMDAVRVRLNPGGVERTIKNTASQDGEHVTIGLEQDPGQAGKMEAQYLQRQLAGYNVRIIPKRVDKETAAKPLSAQAEGGNVKVVRGGWNNSFFTVSENFPEGKHDDDVDAASGAFNLMHGHVRRWVPVKATPKVMLPENGRDNEAPFFPIYGGR